MANPSKRKGSAFEVAVVEYLQSVGFPSAERRVTRGKNDAGDIAGVPGWCLELKATRELDLAGAVDEAAREAKHARAPHFAAVIKRRNHGTPAAYAVLTLEQFTELVRRAETPRVAPNSPAAPPLTRETG